MWLKALEIVLSAVSYLYERWQQVRQKQKAKAEVLADQQIEIKKEVKNAGEVRTNADGNADLLLRPDQRGHNED